jgi:hypothetical protein
MHRIIAITLVTALAVVSLNSAQAAIIYSSIGSTYSQNFNSLPNTPQNTNLQATPTPNMKWIDDTASPPGNDFSMVGWYLWHPVEQTSEGGTNNHQRVRIGAGTATTGAFMSWGASGSTERALGMLNSNTMAVVGDNAFYGALFTNDTGRRLVSMSLSYTGEQWRDGGAATPNAQSILFEYSLNATSVQDTLATWHSVSALDFTSPTFVNTGGGTATDGNAAANRMTKSVTDLDLFWSGWHDGNDLWIRWKDLSNAGNDHGLGIDDLQFSAEIPEPASILLVALAAISLISIRREA